MLRKLAGFTPLRLRLWFPFCLLLLAIQFLVACQPSAILFADPPDIQRLPQDPLYYVSDKDSSRLLLSAELQNQRAEELLSLFFLPWQAVWLPVSKTDAYWPMETFAQETAFVALARPRPATWLKDLARQAQIETYPSLDRKGIILRNTDCRSLPDRQPAFRDPQLAGEGYPFDYLQNSTLWGGTPVRILHRSADHAWLFVESPLAYGWVIASDVAVVDDLFVQEYQSGHYAVVIEDRVPLIDSEGQFLFLGRLGSLFPLSLSSNTAELMVPAADTEGRAVARRVTVPASAMNGFPLPATGLNLALVARQLMNEPYGWGGLNHTRDCSALTHDLFFPFGIWLPRNSLQQSRAGEEVDLVGLDPKAKEKRIISSGVPFLTLLYRPGHVMLYLGTYQGAAVIMHNMWGLKIHTRFGEGRKVVGRAVITSLQPGNGVAELQRPEGELLPSLGKMTIIGRIPYVWPNPPREEP